MVILPRMLTTSFLRSAVLSVAASILVAAPAESQVADSTALRFDTLALAVNMRCGPQCGVNSMSLRSFVVRHMAERGIVTHRRHSPDELGLAIRIRMESSDLGGQLTYNASATLRSTQRLWQQSETGFVTAQRARQDSEAIAARLVDALFAAYGIPRRN